MEENKDINGLSPSDVQKLKMDPPENAWNKLDAELARKQALINDKRANRFRLLFILTGLLLLCSLTYFFLAPSKVRIISANENKTLAPATNDNAINHTQTNTTKDVINNSTPSVKSKSDISHSIPAIDNTLKNQSATNRKNIVSINNNSTSVKKTGKQHAAITSVKSSSIQNNLKILGDIKNDEPQPKANDIQTTINNNSADLATTLQAQDKTTSSPTEQNSTITKSETEKTDLPITSPVNSGSVTSSAVSSNAATSKPVTRPVIAKPDSVKPEEKPAIAQEKPAENNPANTFINTKPKNLLSRVSVAAFYSPDYSKNHLTDNNPKFPPSLYYEYEKIKFSYSTGLSLRYDLTSHLSASIGATYSIISYSIALPTIYANYDANNELHYMYPTSCGIIEMPNSSQYTAWYKGESLSNTSCTQVVRFISIPLLARYQIALHKFRFYVELGPEANFMMQERANMYVNGTESTIVNNINGINKMTYGFIGAAGAQYNFLNGIGVFVEPSYRRSFTSLTHNTAVNCYPISLGANVGLSLHF